MKIFKTIYVAPVTETSFVEVKMGILAASHKQEEAAWDNQLSKKKAVADWEEEHINTTGSKSLWE